MGRTCSSRNHSATSASKMSSRWYIYLRTRSRKLKGMQYKKQQFLDIGYQAAKKNGQGGCGGGESYWMTWIMLLKEILGHNSERRTFRWDHVVPVTKMGIQGNYLMCTSQNVCEKTEGCREEKKRLKEVWKDREVIGEEKGKEQRAGERRAEVCTGLPWNLRLCAIVHGCEARR